MDDHFANDTWRCNDYVQQQFFVEESIHGGSVKAAGSGGKDFGSTLTAINMEGEDPFMSGRYPCRVGCPVSRLGRSPSGSLVLAPPSPSLLGLSCSYPLTLMPPLSCTQVPECARLATHTLSRLLSLNASHYCCAILELVQPLFRQQLLLNVYLSAILAQNANTISCFPLDVPGACVYSLLRSFLIDCLLRCQPP